MHLELKAPVRSYVTVVIAIIPRGEAGVGSEIVMEAHALFIIVDPHGGGEHEIIEKIFPNLDVIISCLVIIQAAIVVSQTGGNTNQV